MVHRAFTESDIEAAALDWLVAAGWSAASGADLPSDGPAAERTDYRAVILPQRLRHALERLNPDAPPEALAYAIQRLTHPDGATLIQRNRAVHRMLVDGVPVEYRAADGTIRGMQVQVIQYDDPTANDWLAVSQLTIMAERRIRRPDVILFVNGLPLVVIELKHAADPDATLWDAWQQLQTYQTELESLFVFAAALVISDGVDARIGPIGAGREGFRPWRTRGDGTLPPPEMPLLQVMIDGALAPPRLLRLIRHFIVFEDDGGGQVVKKLAAYHQVGAVEAAVRATMRAAGITDSSAPLPDAATDAAVGHPAAPRGDRRIGVVWHTQGSGKSLTMVCYAAWVSREPALANPTIVVLTDRNDLDDQLFATFSRCADLLRQTPLQAENRRHLRQLLAVPHGGVIFTTIQKFLPDDQEDRHPLLSKRWNIIVIADEAHRSQYDFIDGFARHLRDALPFAAFIGFTGTPLERADANTRAVFGDYISIYDVQRAVDDGATVPIYYESRVAQIGLDPQTRPTLDQDFEDLTEGEEVERKEQLKTRWAQLEAIVGAGPRLRLIAEDLVQHLEARWRALDGKAMIVCMSRRICVDLYDQIAALRPHWVGATDADGMLKVVMTGSATDPVAWQPHLRTKEQRAALARRFRDPADSLRVVIVRDMWLTGFDCPSLHTLYLDKPMRGHGLMQAIARVNRVFPNKSSGLVVDYLGLAAPLRDALAVYADSGGQGRPVIDQAHAVNELERQLDICRGLIGTVDMHAWVHGPAPHRLSTLTAALEHVLAQPDGTMRMQDAARAMLRAFLAAVPHPRTREVRDEVTLVRALAAALSKRTTSAASPAADLEVQVQRLVDQAIVSEGVMDLQALLGLPPTDLAALSVEALDRVRQAPHRHLAVEAMQRMVMDAVRQRQRTHLVQGQSFAARLDQAIRRYRSRALDAVQMLNELIALAQDLRQANARGESLGLSDEELAFYDALSAHATAVQVMGDAALGAIARELAATVRAHVTIDWTRRENARARLRVLVKRTLRRHGYPPDGQETATQLVIDQAAALSDAWVSAAPESLAA